MIKAVIFDFDGVITDSEPVHLMMFQKVLWEKGISLTEKDYYDNYLGMDDKGCFATLLQSHGMTTDSSLIQSLIDRKTQYLMSYIKDHLYIYPGVVDLIGELKEHYSLAIASGALRHEIEFVLSQAGVRSAFDVIVSAEDVLEGKPNPECFHKALEALNHGAGDQIRSDECVVIEDSVAGIEAAHAAGMICIAVSNTYSHERLVTADRTVKSLNEINAVDINALINHP